jgi:hypothetical protein
MVFFLKPNIFFCYQVADAIAVRSDIYDWNDGANNPSAPQMFRFGTILNSAQPRKPLYHRFMGNEKVAAPGVEEHLHKERFSKLDFLQFNAEIANI